MAVAAALVAGTGVAVHSALRAAAARDDALRAQAREARHRAVAETASAQAKMINDLLHQMIVSVNPRRTGDEALFRKSIDEAVARLDGGVLRDQPEVEAAMRTALADVYASWNHYPPAESASTARRWTCAGGSTRLITPRSPRAWRRWDGSCTAKEKTVTRSRS